MIGERLSALNLSNSCTKEVVSITVILAAGARAKETVGPGRSDATLSPVSTIRGLGRLK
jgi:hypothetical protein